MLFEIVIYLPTQEFLVQLDKNMIKAETIELGIKMVVTRIWNIGKLMECCKGLKCISSIKYISSGDLIIVN